MYAYIFKTTRRILMRALLIDRVIQGEDFYLYYMHNIVESHFKNKK
jgi:hypothetical protein